MMFPHGSIIALVVRLLASVRTVVDTNKSITPAFRGTIPSKKDGDDAWRLLPDGTHKFEGWIIRKVIYPVLNMPPLMTFSETEWPEDWKEISSVTRTELIWTRTYQWPTVEDMNRGVYQCHKIFANAPDIIIAGWPTKYKGVDVR